MFTVIEVQLIMLLFGEVNCSFLFGYIDCICIIYIYIYNEVDAYNLFCGETNYMKEEVGAPFGTH